MWITLKRLGMQWRGTNENEDFVEGTQAQNNLDNKTALLIPVYVNFLFSIITQTIEIECIYISIMENMPCFCISWNIPESIISQDG